MSAEFDHETDLDEDQEPDEVEDEVEEGILLPEDPIDRAFALFLLMLIGGWIGGLIGAGCGFLRGATAGLEVAHMGAGGGLLGAGLGMLFVVILVGVAKMKGKNNGGY